ncbi:MAG: type II secretion system F family protein [Candidatus Melainabacteria bacterium]|nr:type II secretion system F family protein [Candidatus Melainabacteria bacterium]
MPEMTTTVNATTQASVAASNAAATASAAAVGDPGQLMALLPIAIGVLGLILALVIFLVVSGYLDMTTEEESPIKNRLRAIRDDTLNGGRVQLTTAQRFKVYQEQLMVKLHPVAQQMYGKNDMYLDKIRILLSEAGQPDSDNAVQLFLTTRVMFGLAFGGALFFMGLVVSMGNLLLMTAGLIMGLLLGSRLPEMRLRGMGKRRREEITYTLPDVLDLMVVCVEAGLGLDATVSRVAEEARTMAPDFAKELKRVMRELNAGLPRQEVFQNLGKRNGVEELKSLCALVIQSDKMGTSISDMLRVYSSDIRTRRRQKAEELASKASVKMSLPLVFFIFPPLAIVLLGPMVITAASIFLPSG